MDLTPHMLNFILSDVSTEEYADSLGNDGTGVIIHKNNIVYVLVPYWINRRRRTFKSFMWVSHPIILDGM
jgi:hypothetical protein